MRQKYKKRFFKIIYLDYDEIMQIVRADLCGICNCINNVINNVW